MTYVKHKMKACKIVGIDTQLFHFNDNVTKDSLVKIIKELNKNEFIDAIMPQVCIFTQL